MSGERDKTKKRGNVERRMATAQQESAVLAGEIFSGKWRKM